MSVNMGNILRLLFLFFTALILLMRCASAAESLVLDPSQPNYVFGTYLEYREDKTGTLTLDELLLNEAPDSWRRSGEGFPNFGFTSSVYWFRVTVKNSESRSVPWLLEIPFPLIDYLDYVEEKEGKVLRLAKTGDNLPFAERPSENRNFVFQFLLGANESKTLYFRIASTEAMQFPAKLWRQESFLVNEEKQTLLLGIALGFLMMMAFYNLFLYMRGADVSHLYYVLFVLASTFFQLVQKGIAYQYLWPEMVGWNHVAVPFFGLGSVLTGYVFSYSFLGIRLYQAWLKLSFKAVMWLSSILALVVISVVPHHQMHIATQVFAAVSILGAVYLLVASIYLWVKGNHTAKYLIVAWACFILGVIIFGASRFGLISTNLFTDNAMLIGSSFELVLASIALADKLNRAKRQTYEQERLAREAQENRIRLQKQAAEQLEVQVGQRTKELEKMTSELEATHAQLKQLSTKDALTDLYNRHFLAEKLPYIRNEAQRHSSPFSFLLMDIDHFKSINDRFGHNIGDLCLKEVADCLRKNVYRAIDICARYGGEEFLVVLPNTNQDQAFIVAERVREAINRIVVPIDSERVFLSVSVGLYTSHPGDKFSLEECIQQADDALYKAKNAGRNKCQAASDST